MELPGFNLAKELEVLREESPSLIFKLLHVNSTI